jgi:hypothetical protein
MGCAPYLLHVLDVHMLGRLVLPEVHQIVPVVVVLHHDAFEVERLSWRPAAYHIPHLDLEYHGI